MDGVFALATEAHAGIEVGENIARIVLEVAGWND